MGLALDKALAETISEKCKQCGKPVSTGKPRGYHASKLYCGKCGVYFCSGCATNHRYCPTCMTEGQQI